MMKDYRHFNNKLEFTIHGLDEFEISPSSSLELLRVEVDEDIATELQPTTTTTISVENEKRSPGESHSSSSNAECEKELSQLLKVSLNLEDRGESSLLQDLKAMKEEAWAKRKARKLRRAMKRVKFQDELVNSVPFCRSCCAGRKSLGNGSSTAGESETMSRLGESSDNARKGVRIRPTTGGYRPFAHIHSINMFENIIPRSILECRRQRIFTPFSTPVAKMLADIG